MLGKNPLAISPLATLAEVGGSGIQSISIPAPQVVLGSAASPSLKYNISLSTAITATGAALAPTLKPSIVVDVAMTSTATAVAPAFIPTLVIGTASAAASAISPALIPTLAIGTVATSATVIDPTLTLVVSTLSISIPAPQVVTGSAGSPSLVYNIVPGTCVADASAIDLAINLSVVFGNASAAATASALTMTSSVVLNDAEASATAIVPNLLSAVVLSAPMASASAVDPNLLGTVSLNQPVVAAATAQQVSLLNLVALQVAAADATVVDPDITPVPTVIIDAVFAQATAADPVLVSNLVIDGIDVASAQAENISLIPTLGLGTTVASALCPDIYLVNGLSLQVAQTAQALALAPTSNLSVVVDAAPTAAAAYSPQILPGIFLTTANGLAFGVNFAVSGSIFLQPVLASATTGNLGLDYFMTLDTSTAQATAVDPSIELQVDLGSPTVVGASAIAPITSLSVVLVPTAAQAIAHNPLLGYNIHLSQIISVASAVDPALQLGVVLHPAPSIAVAGAVDLIATVAVGPAAVAAAAAPPPLVYNVVLQASTTATSTAVDPTLKSAVFIEHAPATAITFDMGLIATAKIQPTIALASASSPALEYNINPQSSMTAVAQAIDPAMQLSVALDHAPSSASAGDLSFTLTVAVGPVPAEAIVVDPALEYSISIPFTISSATAHSPLLEYNVNLGTPTVASSAAFVPTMLASVKPTAAISLGTSPAIGLEYFLQISTAAASGQATSPALQLHVALGSPLVASATASQPTLLAAVSMDAAATQAFTLDPALSYKILLSTLTAQAYTSGPDLEYNIKTSPALALTLTGSLKIQRAPGEYYIDPVAGNDTNDGLTWTTAWKTMTFGATEPRTVPGDFIKVAKTNDPIAIGCLWTSGSKEVMLSAPRTLSIDDCESGWSAANGSAVSHLTSSKKQRSACVGVSVSSYAASTVYAYRTIPVTDASTYQGLSFWYRAESGVIGPDQWELCLCSDTVGATVVDRFPLPEHPAAGRWMPLNVSRSGSGNLGSLIQSIALYTTVTPPVSPHIVLLDNIQATKTDDLNLTSLISKNGSPTGGDEGFWGIQSISGSTVLLDRDTNCDADSGFGYYGMTEDVPTYIRETYKVPPAATMLTSSLFNVNNSGTPGAHIVYSGGWNTGSNVQDGQTYYDGQNGLGLALYSNNRNFFSASRMSFYRFGSAFYSEGECVGYDINIPNACNNSNAAVMIKDRFLLGEVVLGNVNSNGSPDVSGSGGVSISGGSMDDLVHVKRALSNHDYGVSLECVNNVRLIGPSLIANNECGVRAADCGAGIFVEDTIFDNINVDTSNDSSRLTLVNTTMTGSAVHFERLTNYGYSQKTLSHNHNSTGTNLISHGGGLITSMATTRPGGSGLMWQLLTSDPVRDSFNPLPLYAGQVYCIANVTTTIKAWLKKNHASQVNGRLAVRGRQLAGIPNDVTAVLSSNTGWQELSVSVTPIESGVVQVEVWAEYVSGHQPVYYDQGLSVA